MVSFLDDSDSLAQIMPYKVSPLASKKPSTPMIFCSVWKVQFNNDYCFCFFQGPDEDSNTTKGLGGGGGSKMPSRQQSPVHSRYRPLTLINVLLFMKNIQLYFSSHSAAVGIQGGGSQPASNQSLIAGGKPNRNEAVHTHLNETGNKTGTYAKIS